MPARPDISPRTARRPSSSKPSAKSSPDAAISTRLWSKSSSLHQQPERSQRPHEALSDREYQVLRMIASGLTVSQISTRLSLSVKTISTYRARVLEKMDMKTTAELMHYGIQHGLVD